MTDKKNLPTKFQLLIDESEKLLWVSRPDFWVNLFRVIVNNIYFFVIFTFLPWVLIAIGYFGEVGSDRCGSPCTEEDLGFFFYFGLAWVVFVVLVVIGRLAGSFLAYKNIYYVLTNKRVIMSFGKYGMDFSSVRYPDISNVSVKNDLGMFGRGTIIINTFGSIGSGGVQLRFRLVDNPYKVFKKIKQLQDKAS